MSIPFGFYQGNRSEYMAIPALSRLGFTIPVPRQENHFGVDFIVHLAKNVDNVVVPTGKAFGIQIKSDKETLAFDTPDRRDCVYNSSLPFFLGVVSRRDLTLTVYNTLNRLSFFWMLGPQTSFSLAVTEGGDGVPKPDFEGRVGGTGKPIIEISISEPSTSGQRSGQIEMLQSTMQSWIDLENENLSLKEQGIALLFWPSTYATNRPIKKGRIETETFSYTKFAGPSSLPQVCRATERALVSLSFYLRKMPRANVPDLLGNQMDEMHPKADALRRECETLRKNWHDDKGPPAMPSESPAQ